MTLDTVTDRKRRRIYKHAEGCMIVQDLDERELERFRLDEDTPACFVQMMNLKILSGWFDTHPLAYIGQADPR